MTQFNELNLESVKIPSFQERIDKLNEMIAGARHIVFFTGAGISTGSGIPDFRSADGLYADNPEYLLSATCLQSEPQKFFNFIKNKMDFREAEPKYRPSKNC